MSDKDTNKERKFYKTIVSLEVLSEGPIPSGMALANILRETIYGTWSALRQPDQATELTPEQFAEACGVHATDPEFFGLNPDGTFVEDVDTDEDTDED